MHQYHIGTYHQSIYHLQKRTNKGIVEDIRYWVWNPWSVFGLESVQYRHLWLLNVSFKKKEHSSEKQVLKFRLCLSRSLMTSQNGAGGQKIFFLKKPNLERVGELVPALAHTVCRIFIISQIYHFFIILYLNIKQAL